MRLLDPRPKERRRTAADREAYDLGQAIAVLSKTAADTPQKSFAMSGRLVVPSSGWALLEVPNSFVRGVFESLNEPGLQLPLKDGRLRAHISVMRSEEVEQIGGPDKLTERGKSFRYTLGPLQSVRPHGWQDVSKVWFVKVESPELKELRKSYGLPPLPHKGPVEMQFHITVAIRRIGVLHPDGRAKNDAGDQVTLPVVESQSETRKVAHVDGGAIKAERTQSVVSGNQDPNQVSEHAQTQHTRNGDEAPDEQNQMSSDIRDLLKLSNQKVSQEEANYRPATAQDLAAGRSCETCKHFKPEENSCYVVEGDIQPNMVSDLFEPVTPEGGIQPIQPIQQGPQFAKLIEPMGAPSIGSAAPAAELPEPPPTASDIFKTAARAASLRRLMKYAGLGEDLEKARSSTEPPASADQADAGNYKKGKVRMHGFTISLETPKGKTRSGTAANGKQWSVVMKHDYGYIARTKGKDGDHVDVFIGPNPGSELVFVINQVNPGNKSFDEHKVMLGFDTEAEARAGYLSNYEEGWAGLGSIVPMTIDQFKAWLDRGSQRKPAKPFLLPKVSFCKAAEDQTPTVAVDLDGTIAKPYEEYEAGVIPEPREGAVDAIRTLHDEGYKVIINTCRGDVEAISNYLDDHDIPYDHINENPDQPADTSDKVLADVYVDDRSIDGSAEWSSILDQVRDRTKEAANYMVKSSSTHGLGLFAAKDFTTGDRVGTAVVKEGEDGFGRDKLVCTIAGRYLNYGESPNVEFRKHGEAYDMYAVQSIKEGSELYASQRYHREHRVMGMPHDAQLREGAIAKIAAPNTQLEDDTACGRDAGDDVDDPTCTNRRPKRTGGSGGGVDQIVSNANTAGGGSAISSGGGGDGGGGGGI